MYELNPNEFLFVFYTQLSKKLKRVLELTANSNKTLSETTELFETKDKIITALDMLAMESNDNMLKKSYKTLAMLIISTQVEDIKTALDFCNECRF